MSKLLHFLIDLATDPQKQIAFASIPEAVMDAAQLGEADKLALKSKDKAKIAAPFADECLQIFCMDPVPDPMPDPDPPEPDSPDSEPSDKAALASSY